MPQQIVDETVLQKFKKGTKTKKKHKTKTKN